MITTPIEKQRAKSYYIAPHHGRHHEDNRSIGNNSVRVDQRKSSNPKKQQRKDKNKSLERDQTVNSSKYFKTSNKTMKRVVFSLFSKSRWVNQWTSRWTNRLLNTSNPPISDTMMMTITPDLGLKVRSRRSAWATKSHTKAAIWSEWSRELTGPSSPSGRAKVEK